MASTFSFSWVRSKSLIALDVMTRSRWVDWVFIVSVIFLSLVAWQVKPLMQAPQALGECLESEVLSVLSMPPACLADVIKKHGDNKNVVLGILTLTTPAVTAKSKNAVFWCSAARIALQEYDDRTRWSDWKQGLWGDDASIVEGQLAKVRKLCAAAQAPVKQ